MSNSNKKEYGSMPETGFIRIGHVLHVLGIAKTTLYEGIQKGIFPAPKKLTSRTSVWSVEEIRQFINNVNNANA